MTTIQAQYCYGCFLLVELLTGFLTFAGGLQRRSLRKFSVYSLHSGTTLSREERAQLTTSQKWQARLQTILGTNPSFYVQKSWIRIGVV